MTETASSIAITSIALIVCLILAWFFLKGLARLSGGAQPGSKLLRVVATLHVGSRERVSVVEYKGREYVLGITSSSIRLLDKCNVDNNESE